MTTLIGPVIESQPIRVYQGRSFKLRVAVRDGVVAEGLPYGALVDCDAATIKGVMTIVEPDGVADCEKDTSVVGEGLKEDSNSDGKDDTFFFTVDPDETVLWELGTYIGGVRFINSATDPEDDVAIYIFRINVVTYPSD